MERDRSPLAGRRTPLGASAACRTCAGVPVVPAGRLPGGRRRGAPPAAGAGPAGAGSAGGPAGTGPARARPVARVGPSTASRRSASTSTRASQPSRRQVWMRVSICSAIPAARAQAAAVPCTACPAAARAARSAAASARCRAATAAPSSMPNSSRPISTATAPAAHTVANPASAGRGLFTGPRPVRAPRPPGHPPAAGAAAPVAR